MSDRRRGAQAFRTLAGWTWLVGLAGVLSLGISARARADIDTVSLGSGASLPVAAPYITYGRFPDFEGDVVMKSGSLPAGFGLYGTAHVGVATVNNTTTQVTRLWMYSVLGGIRYQTPSEGTGLRPYVGLQIGGMYDVLGFNGQTNVTQDTGIEFVSRFSTGFEIWLTPKFAIDLGVPVDFLAVKNGLFILETIGSVRVRL